MTYQYDGDGRRVAKASTANPPVPFKFYWYGAGGDILAETAGTGTLQNEYVFFGGSRIALVPAAGNPNYYVEDLLGTSRVLTSSTGTVCYDADFYPYGGQRSYTETCRQFYKFEGKERDSETGNDDFGARYYSNRFGRWLSADWSSVPVAVPYANLTNSQTLNLYSMVSDDPESFADLDGHFRLSPTDAPCTSSSSGEGCGNTAAELGNTQAQSQAQAQNQNIQQNVADTAQKYDGSKDWAFTAQKGAFACNTNKCNAFVGDVTLNLSSDSGSLRKTPHCIFNRLQTLFLLSSFLCKKSPRLFSIVYELFYFPCKRAPVYFQAFTNSFFAKKTTLLFLFIDLRTLFCKMSFFLKGLNVMAINPQLPYPRLRCQYRTQTGRQCRLHVLDPKDTLCPQHVYARAMAFLSTSKNNFRLSR